jgi:hypothetical protein
MLRKTNPEPIIAIDPVSGTADAARGPVGAAAGRADAVPELDCAVDPFGGGTGSVVVIGIPTAAGVDVGFVVPVGSGAGGSIDGTAGSGVASAVTPFEGAVLPSNVFI